MTVFADTPRKDAKRINEAFESWVEIVLAALRKAQKLGTIFENPTIITANHLSLPKGDVENLFGKISIRLVVLERVDSNNLPLTVGNGRSAYGYFTPSRNELTLPYIGSDGLLLKNIKSLTFRHTLSHEAEHFLDYVKKSAFFPSPEQLDKDRDVEWFNKATEFNALWREILTSVRRLLKLIRADLDASTHKFKPKLVVMLFESFVKFQVFKDAIRDSMLNKQSPNAIFEFGKTQHFNELARRCLDDRNVYKFHREFNNRLRGLHEDVIEWLEDYKKAIK